MNDSVINVLLKLSYFIIKQNNVSVETDFLIAIKGYFQRFNISVDSDVLATKFQFQKHGSKPNQKNYQQHSRDNDIKSICSNFDSQLLIHEKLFIVICLVECSSRCGFYTRITNDIINQLVINCNINTKDFKNIKEFILEKDEQKLILHSDLFISSAKEDINDELEGSWIEKNRPSEMVNIPSIICEDIKGKVFFNYQQSLNNILFKYLGGDSIYYNKELIKPGEIYLFKNKDKLVFNNKVILDYKELSTIILKQFNNRSVVLTGNSIEYNSKRQFNSIKSFTFSEKSGSLVGVIGGKKSEKNVLIKLLVGELTPDKGNITINGYGIKQNSFKTQGLIGYVPEEERLRGGLSIYENYFYTAKLYLRNYSNNQIKELILRTINELGLQNLVSVIWNRQTKENLSEVQLKLICLGFEIIKDTSIILFEEAFRGLTPIEAQTLIGILREQAMKGKIIIASSTPPLLFNIKEFDRVWFFDKGGYPIYNGKPDTILSYFSEISKKNGGDNDSYSNLEVWQVINKHTLDKNAEFTNKREISPAGWHNYYIENIAPKIKIHGFRNVLPQSRVKLPDLDKQLFVFLKRDLKAFFRQPPLFFTYLSVFVAVAFLTGIFCRHSKLEHYSFMSNGNLSFFYFLNSLNSLVLGIWIGVGSINREGAFYRLNKLHNLSSISYFSSKISLHILLMVVLFSVYVIISYSIIEHLASAFKHFLIYLLLGVAGSTSGYNIAIYTKSARMVYLLSITIVSFQILFSGQIVPFEKFPPSLNNNKKYVPVVADLSILKWGHEALIVEQAVNNRYSKQLFDEEKFLSLAELYIEHLLPEMQKKVNNCFYLNDNSEDIYALDKNLTIVRNEIEKIPEYFDVFPFEFVSSLEPENFNEEIGLECINYINYIQYHLFEESENREKSLKNKIDSIAAVDSSILKEKYYNESVHHLVTNLDNLKNSFTVENDELIPSIYKVYLSPDSNFGRSHLYAYQKLFNGHYVKTFWFNIIVLWLAVGVAYIFLVTEFIHFARNLLNKYVRNN